MNGMSETIFAPNTTANRAMIVTMLYRLAGTPAVSGPSKFSDVPAGSYYADAVSWASANGIVKGTSESTFAPTADITREQLVTMIYNYCRHIGIDVSASADLSGFTDAGQISSWARDGLGWSVSVGIGNNLLDPGGVATRAQIATLFMRLMENVIK
jgi:hypothetical protein